MRWTADEEDYLRKNCNIEATKVISDKLNRSVGSVRSKARNLNLSFVKSFDKTYRETKECKTCLITFRALKSEKRKFCSRSCSTSYNNKISIKRVKKIYYCQNCSKECRYKRKYCSKDCQFHKRLHTIGDIRKKYKVAASNMYSQIRGKARKIAMLHGYNFCVNCGYNKHVEICHIKSISSFDDAELLEDINHISNLVSLCRNCHWEHDNGLFTIQNKCPRFDSLWAQILLMKGTIFIHTSYYAICKE